MIDLLGDFLIYIFSIEWGTVSLIELVWTTAPAIGIILCAIVAMRCYRNIRALGKSANARILRMREDIYMATREVMVRAIFKGIIFLPCIFTGILSFGYPQSNSITSSSALAGLTIIIMEFLLLGTVIYDEYTFKQLVKRRSQARMRRDDNEGSTNLGISQRSTDSQGDDRLREGEGIRHDPGQGG